MWGFELMCVCSKGANISPYVYMSVYVSNQPCQLADKSSLCRKQTCLFLNPSNPQPNHPNLANLPSLTHSTPNTHTHNPLSACQWQ